MCKNLEQLIVGHCAPTLAGLKIANLFCYPYRDVLSLNNDLVKLKKLLRVKGLNFKLIKRCSKKCQIYIYREQMLLKTLQQKDVARFLKKYNYPQSLDKALSHLANRFTSCNEFPHELGVFLGYPLADVKGFIKHGGKNFVCSGCWKAYSNKDKAEKLFTKYKKCKQVYIKCYKNGTPISRLTVAA
ncbi:MAG: DUF3793 family protein [Christensenellaceae bacterium]|nr:DUF3793 family protein [Christensenellaceae bacterium]